MLAIHGTRVDDPQRPYIIAELSGNHGNDYAQAERLVAAAAEAGADAVKVQTFTPEELCADIALPVGFNAETDAWFARMGVTRMRELFSKGGFPRQWHAKLKQYAEHHGVTFLSTPFSVDAARFLINEIGVPALKIASGDLTFTPLLTYAAQQTVPVLLSTGGATEEEIYDAVLYGPLHPCLSRGRLAILHCVSIYPCPPHDANLSAIGYMRDLFRAMGLDIPMGWSDHTLDVTVVPALAVACGATVIEKHLRLDDDNTSVDVDHSITPHQFATMVNTVRQAPAILGAGGKEPLARERHDRLWARRDPSDWLRPTRAAREGAWA